MLCHFVLKVELPLGATEDRICGTIDIEKALQEGIKAYEPGLLVSTSLQCQCCMQSTAVSAFHAAQSNWFVWCCLLTIYGHAMSESNSVDVCKAREHQWQRMEIQGACSDCYWQAF